MPEPTFKKALCRTRSFGGVRDKYRDGEEDYGTSMNSISVSVSLSLLEMLTSETYALFFRTSNNVSLSAYI